MPPRKRKAAAAAKEDVDSSSGAAAGASTGSSRPKRQAVDNTAARAKKDRGETDLAEGLCWTAEGKPLKGVCPLLVLSSSQVEGREKVAGFDIDFTVIKTASGRKFATGESVILSLCHVAVSVNLSHSQSVNA